MTNTYDWHPDRATITSYDNYIQPGQTYQFNVPRYDTTANATWVSNNTTIPSTSFQVDTVKVNATNLADAHRQAAQQLQQASRTAQRLQGAISRLDNAVDVQPTSKRDSLKTKMAKAFEKVKGGGMVPVVDPSKLKTPGGMELLPIGGAAPNAEVDYEVIEEPPPAPAPPPRRKKVMMERTAGIKRDKGSGPVETHTGKVTFVRQMEGPDHLTENIGVRGEPNGSTNHIEIPKKMLLKALKDLSLEDEDLAEELRKI